MNRSLIQDSHIQVAIYDDRLEITSPGGLQPGVTVDLMKQGFSKIRNRALANAFAYMNLVEEWGSGIPKLMQSMKEYGLREPEFMDMDVAFRVNLYRGQSTSIDLKPERNEVNYDHDDPEKDIPDPIQAQNDLKRLNGDLNYEGIDLKSQAMQDSSGRAQRDFELQLIDVIRQNPSLTYKAYGEKLSVSQATIKRLVAKLKENGSIRREGSQRKGTWIITDE